MELHALLTLTLDGGMLNFTHQPHFSRDKTLILLEREPGRVAKSVGNFGEGNNLLHLLEYETLIVQSVTYLLYRLR